MSEPEEGGSAPRPEKMVTARKANRREDIVAAAQALFSEQGYHATSVRQIAEVVGIKVASLYAHIEGKEELLNEAMLAVARRFTEAASEACDQPGSASDQLRYLIHKHLEIAGEQTELARILNLEWREVAVKGELQTLRDEYEELLQQILDRGRAVGEFSIPDNRLGVYYIAAVLNSVCLWYDKRGSLRLTEITHDYSVLIINAVVGSNQIDSSKSADK